MIVNVFNSQKTLKIDPDAVVPLVQQVIKSEKQSCDEVSIYFVNTKKICKLHKDFFDDPSTTDCISFPLDDDDDFPYRILGEVFVCPETALKYAEDHEGDPFEETTLYIVHGLLHLMGYDDIDEKKRALMRLAEAKHMKKLKKLDLYLKPLIQ